MFKKFIYAVLFLFLFQSVSFAAGSSVSWSYAGSKERKWIEVTATFTCHSSGGAFETTPIYLNETTESSGQVMDFTGMYLYHVAYYYGSTAPTDNSDIEIREHSSSGRDILHGAGANMIDNATNNNFKPWINSAESAMPIYGPLYLYITGNSVNSASGTLVMRFLPGDM